MRTARYHFAGKDYLVCMSAYVTTHMEAEHISLEDIDRSEATTTTVLKVLSFMIEAGDAYAKMFGFENPGTVSFEQLCIGTDIADFNKITKLIGEVVRGDRNVEAEEPKKAEAPAM